MRKSKRAKDSTDSSDHSDINYSAIYIDPGERVGFINLPSNTPHSDPFCLFSLFCPHSNFEQWAAYTNKNASQQRAKYPAKHPRPWKDLSSYDVKAYIGILLLLGLDASSKPISEYWSLDEDDVWYPFTEYCSKDRFEQISRFFKVSEPIADDEQELP